MRKFIFLFISAFMAMMCVISCDMEQSGSGESGGDVTPVTPKVKYYTVRFGANGGSGNMADLTADNGQEITVPSCTFTAPADKKFSHWNDASDDSKTYTVGAKLTSTDGKIVTLKAIWIDAASFSITYHNTKGDVDPNIVTFKETDTIVLKDLTADGYTFGGWYDSSTDFSDAHHITGWEAGVKTANVILWGKWTANEVNYTVKTLFQNVSGSGYDESGDAVTKKGLTDSTTDATAGNVAGFELQTIIQQIIAGNGSTVVEIKYNRKNIAYTFKTNGGEWTDGTAADKTVSGKFGAAVDIPVPTKTGYHCSWNPAVSETFGAENQTFTAQWTANTYAIVFNANGGTGTMANLPMTYDVSADLTANTFTKENYVLKGWATSADGNVVYANGQEVKNLTAAQNGEVTLYAVWALGYECTIANLEDLLATLSADEQYLIRITDNEPSLSTIKTVLTGNSDVSVDLDLSLCMGLTSIGENAFAACAGLTSVTIPESVTNIGYYAFLGCTGLTSVTIPDSVTNIGYYAFYGCTGLTSITIPDSVTSIDEGTFSNCSGLTSVEIPDSVTSIGGEAFAACAGLTSITIPDSVTSIGSGTFYDCRKLTSVTIPDSVTSIDGTAFEYCTSLTSITIPENVTSIGDYAFYYCTGLTSVTIPDSVTSIGNSAFGYCTSLTSITIPENVTSIDDEVFSSCTGLTSITILGNVTSIGDRAFANCTGLTSVTIPDSVTSIGNSAFSSCTGLTSVTIPDSVTGIGTNALYWCSHLTTLIVKATTPPTFGSGMLGECSALTSILVPADSVDAYKAASGWSGFASKISAIPTNP